MRFAVLDIETRIDKTLLKAVFGADAANEDQAYVQMRDQLGNGFFPISLHVPIAIGWGEVNADHVLESVTCLAEAGSEEAMVREFWHRAERTGDLLVTFNGTRFDLPVLELQALRWGLSAPRHFAQRRGDQPRHLDLLDFLTNGGAVGLRGGLDLALKLIGLPGKGTVDGGQVQSLYEAGRMVEIRQYCLRDVIQTYFLFLRVELMRGHLDHSQYQRALALSSHFLAQLDPVEAR
ncbi:MAG TPA: ribonuclease H-like domain-containing protein [Candidatus Binataceae bacterium]|nr:ribonuclease H-like domain-containing protein [Candidatus Binataceae bacterium]